MPLGLAPFDPRTTDRIYGGIYGTSAPGILSLAGLGPQAAAGPQPPFDPNAPAGPGGGSPPVTAPTFTIVPPSLNPPGPIGGAPAAAPQAPPAPPAPVPAQAGPKYQYGDTPASAPPVPAAQAATGQQATGVPLPPPRPSGLGVPVPLPPVRPAGLGAAQTPGVAHVQGPDFLKKFFLAGQQAPTGMTGLLNQVARPEGDRGGMR